MRLAPKRLPNRASVSQLKSILSSRLSKNPKQPRLQVVSTAASTCKQTQAYFGQILRRFSLKDLRINSYLVYKTERALHQYEWK
jgi:hypothetical protein